MNRREKSLLARVYVCVGRLGSVGPRNPADIGGLARADHLVAKAAPAIAQGISALGFGDYDVAGDYLGDAEDLLGLDRGPGFADEDDQ